MKQRRPPGPCTCSRCRRNNAEVESYLNSTRRHIINNSKWSITKVPKNSISQPSTTLRRSFTTFGPEISLDQVRHTLGRHSSPSLFACYCPLNIVMHLEKHLTEDSYSNSVYLQRTIASDRLEAELCCPGFPPRSHLIGPLQHIGVRWPAPRIATSTMICPQPASRHGPGNRCSLLSINAGVEMRP